MRVDPFAQWSCSECKFETSHAAVRQVAATIQDEITTLLRFPTMKQRIDQLEHLLSKYLQVLHENHFILTSIRQYLIEMYGRVDGYLYNNLPVVLLDRKLDLCRQVMLMLDIFNPGLTRSRALLLYEMHVPLILTARAKLLTHSLSCEQYKDRIHEAICLLEQCKAILQWEDDNSPEALINREVVVNLKQLRADVD